MQQVTVGTKYQIVLPKEIRQKIKGIKPGKKVAIYQTEKDTIIMKPVQEDWVERTHGIATKAWRNIDPIKELDKMRDEWEERLEELEKEFK